MNCKKCGAEVAGNAAFCENCGTPIDVQAPVMGSPEIPTAPQENVLLGTVGALVGAVIGGGLMILLSQIGVFASIAGVVLAFCSLKGYELLGKHLSLKGVIIAVVLMVVTPFVADTLDWGILLSNEFASLGYEVSVIDAALMVPDMLAEGAIEMEVYIQNLLMLYVFTALGAFSLIMDAFKKNKK